MGAIGMKTPQKQTNASHFMQLPPHGPCVPGTLTDGCHVVGKYASNVEECFDLGPIGCRGQACSWMTDDQNVTSCRSAHATTTSAPCRPGTSTDKCFSRCSWGCNEQQCLELQRLGCNDAVCEWHAATGN